MAFDKAKTLRAAEKFLAQGKIPAAIKEYRQIVDNDAGDLTALNMLGDLYVRQKDKSQAVQCFLHIAEHYRQEGFQNKAIAMFKKIDRLEPRNPDIASKLATLYENQGLIVDARTQYMVVAESYLRDGQTRKALEILRKVADLDPQNTEARIKLAQGYVREGLNQEAAEAFTEAGERLLARGQHERAIEAYTLALGINPQDQVSLNGYLNAHIACGTPEEAAEVLERALAAQPDSVEMLSMLAHAYVASEDAPAAERTVASLAMREASTYGRFVDVARLYLKKGEADAAVRVLSGITEQMLDGREEDKLMELLNEVLAHDPEHIEALRLLIRVYAWQRDDEKQVQALRRLAEAAEAADLPDVERSALAQIVQFTPDQNYLDRLQAIGYSPEQKQAERSYEPPAPSSGGEGVPTFESFAFVNEESGTASAMGLPETQEGASEFEFNTVAPPAPTVDPSSSFADLNDDWNAPGASDATPPTPPPGSPGAFQEFDFGGDSAQPAPGEQTAGAAATVEMDERRLAMLRQELDSVDFYIAQGYTDIALDTLEMLEKQFGAHEEINSRRAKLDSSAAPPAGGASFVEPPPQTIEFESFASYDVAEVVTPVEAESFEVDEIFARTENAPPEAASPSSPPASQSASAPPKPLAETTTPAGQGIDPGLAAIFDEFREAAEEEEPALDGDYETHYNMGIAYKEMELFDEAVEEFQTAAAMASVNDGTARFLQCCNMLGHCFMSKDIPRLAVMWFKKGLEAPGHTEDEYQALRYDLGTAYEQMGNLDKAIDVFTEVYGINISYRGVAEKLRELQDQRAVNSES
jgi:tetratricopeptide (TPR) repeat protein